MEGRHEAPSGGVDQHRAAAAEGLGEKRERIGRAVERSIARGNGLLGIYSHMLKDQNAKTDTKGAKPKQLIDHAAPCYNWDKDKFATWVEKAAVKAGHPCLKHGKKGCISCA